MLSRRILIRALLCSLLALVPFPELESNIYDLELGLLKSGHKRRTDEVVILEMSKTDFASLKRRFDSESGSRRERTLGTWYEKFESVRDEHLWNDALYHALLESILAEKPQSVLVAFYYPDNIIQLLNRPVLQKLTRDHRVIWSSHFDADQKFVKPAAELIGSENYGFHNLITDPDGKVRRAVLVMNNHGSLPFRALLGENEPGPTDRNLEKPFLIHYLGGTGAIQSCRVLEECTSLTGKTVILAPASNSPASPDSFPTPVGVLSRAEILANIYLTAKHQSEFVPVSRYLLLFFVFVHVLILANALLNRNARYHIPLTAALFLLEGGLALGSLALFRRQIPLVPFLLATAMAYFAFLWLKYARQDNKRWQAEKKAQYLSELDELKSNFLSLMSHDLKTPIAKVQALTERLAREAQGLTAAQRDILESIQRSNDELSSYILSILNFQRIESQQLILRPKSNDINLLIEEVVRRLEPLATEKKIQVTTELEPMFSAEFDELLIRQVLNNLIENAVKYNPEGTKVVIRSGEEGENVFVCVEDNGAGIDDAQKDRLFKKFSRIEKGTSERVKGTGLGLYLAKYFIELHGGKIQVESALGKGTTFRFDLPINGPEAAQK